VHAAFGKDTIRIISPDSLEYHVLDDDSDPAVIYVDSNDSDDATSEEEVEASVEAVQCLYLVFQPPHLCLERLEENIGEKCHRTINKLPVYTGSLQTTLWRKNTTRKDAAKGCTTLDAFIVRKVCTYPANGGSVSHFRQKRQRSPSPIDSDIEEVMAPVVCLEARAAAVWDDTLPASANNPTAPRLEEALAQSKVDLAVPHWIKDTEVVLARSAANLPACNPDASTNDTYEGLA
jgi:hypothetical protein